MSKRSWSRARRAACATAVLVGGLVACRDDLTRPEGRRAPGPGAAHRTVTPAPPGLQYVGYYEHIRASYIRGHGNLVIVEHAEQVDDAKANGLHYMFKIGFDLSSNDWRTLLSNAISGVASHFDTALVAFYIDEPFQNYGGIGLELLRLRIDSITGRLRQDYPGMPLAVVEAYPFLESAYQPPDSADWLGFDCYSPSWDACGDPAHPHSIPYYLTTLRNAIAAGIAAGRGSRRIILTPMSGYQLSLTGKSDEQLFQAASQGITCNTLDAPTCADQDALVSLLHQYDGVAQNDNSVIAILGYTGTLLVDGTAYIGTFGLNRVRVAYDAVFARIGAVGPSVQPPAAHMSSGLPVAQVDQTPGAKTQSNPSVIVNSAIPGAPGVPGVNVVCNPYENSSLEYPMIATGGSSGSWSEPGDGAFKWHLGTLSGHIYALVCRAPLVWQEPVSFLAKTVGTADHTYRLVPSSYDGYWGYDLLVFAPVYERVIVKLVDENDTPKDGVAIECTPSNASHVVRAKSITGLRGPSGTVGFQWILEQGPAAYTLTCTAPAPFNLTYIFHASWHEATRHFLWTDIVVNDLPPYQPTPSDPRITVLNENNLPENGVTVTCSATPGSSLQSTTRVSGQDGPGVAAFHWTLGAGSKTYTMQCTVPSAVPTTATFTAVTRPSTYHFAAPNGSSWNSPAVPVNSSTPMNPYVQLLDEGNVPIPDVPVTCSAHNGSILTWTTRTTGTDGPGMAAFIWTMPPTPGSVTMDCSAPSPYNTAAFTFTATARALTYHFAAPNGSAWYDVPVSTYTPMNPYVQLLDENNAPVNSVTVSCTPTGGSTLLWTTRVTGTDGPGMAAFVWAMAATPGAVSLTCTAPSPYNTSYTFNATAVSPYHFALPNGTSWSTPANTYTPGNPYVQLMNGSSPVDGVTITCTPSAGSSVLWTTRVTGQVEGAGTGQAAFVWMLGAPGSYTLTCTAPAPYNLSYTFHGTSY